MFPYLIFQLRLWNVSLIDRGAGHQDVEHNINRDHLRCSHDREAISCRLCEIVVGLLVQRRWLLSAADP